MRPFLASLLCFFGWVVRLAAADAMTVIGVLKQVHTVYTHRAEIFGQSPVEPKGVITELEAFSPTIDAELCAIELSHKLTDAIDQDDSFSTRSWRDGEGGEHGMGNWRDKNAVSWQKLKLGCNVKSWTEKQAVIICSAQIGDDKPYAFVTYYAYFPHGHPDGTAEAEYDRRVEAAIMEDRKGASSNHACFGALMEEGNGIRFLSPFHPLQSIFDVQFRRDRLQLTCKLVLDPRSDPTHQVSLAGRPLLLALESMAMEAPRLFYRLVGDVYLPLPRSCVGFLPSVQPALAREGNALKHMASVRQFISKYCQGQARAFQVLYDWSSPRPQAHEAPLVCRLQTQIAACLAEPGPKFYRCHHRMVVWSRSPYCPPTAACYETKMCNRMLPCGNGLWIQMRGQNSLESNGRSLQTWSPFPKSFMSNFSGYVPEYDYDKTTKAFYQFAESASAATHGSVEMQKIHFSNSSSSDGIFLVVFHKPGETMLGTMPVAASSVPAAPIPASSLPSQTASNGIDDLSPPAFNFGSASVSAALASPAPSFGALGTRRDLQPQPELGVSQQSSSSSSIQPAVPRQPQQQASHLQHQLPQQQPQLRQQPPRLLSNFQTSNPMPIQPRQFAPQPAQPQHLPRHMSTNSVHSDPFLPHYARSDYSSGVPGLSFSSLIENYDGGQPQRRPSPQPKQEQQRISTSQSVTGTQSGPFQQKLPNFGSARPLPRTNGPK